MARKKFGISPSVNKALTQTIEMANAENSNFMNTEILLNRVILDPENPRKHKITLSDIKNGLSKSDPNYNEKQAELDGLKRLSESIQREGLFHPIIVIEDGSDFKLVAGERRYLASMIVNRKVIDARVFKKKPRNFDLKVIQWAENQSRKDLSLHKKLMNVQLIIDSYNSENSIPLTAIKLSEILGVSRQQAQFFKSILSNKELLKFIENGAVTTMEIARQLSNSSESELANFLQSKKIQVTVPNKPTVVDRSKGKGRKRTSINLGTTKNSIVAKAITETMLSSTVLKPHANDFKNINWNCLNDSTKAFQKLIKLLEKESGAFV